jgi:hypothetical protein
MEDSGPKLASHPLLRELLDLQQDDGGPSMRLEETLELIEECIDALAIDAVLIKSKLLYPHRPVRSDG